MLEIFSFRWFVVSTEFVFLKVYSIVLKLVKKLSTFLKSLLLRLKILFRDAVVDTV